MTIDAETRRKFEEQREEFAPDTKQWTRNASDEKAVADGCIFDPSWGQFVVDWLQENLCLYEGEWAGEPFVCHDWQYEVTMRLFGWKKLSDRWGRAVRRFRRASIWVPKKNKKSPTLAAWMLYLLVGDGEQGQKVFLAAKDGQQAREIAGKHAAEMMIASPQLRAECTLNKSKLQITHEKSRSFLLPLSSANSRTKESKEGINGSVGVDEAHVVDQDFMAIIERAGISRSEPMHIEVSTAGNNPDGYGKKQYDYGKQVEDGTHTDHSFFFTTYEAPYDLSDADLDADPVKYGKMANPSWGHTIDEEEFLADYNRSKVSIGRLAEFKMYRLNLWQRSTNPWLRPDDWAKCERKFTEAELYGKPCGGGLDLSKTEDMTAFSLVFPEDGKPMATTTSEAEGEETQDYNDNPCQVLTWYWLPQRAIELHGHEVDYAQWAKEGWLRIIPGSVIDYSFVEKDIAEILKQFDVQMIGYDKHYAFELMQRLVQYHGHREDRLFEFPQTIMGFAGPTAQLERLVIAEKFNHNANPITTWQAGHVEVKHDANDNIRPVKPPHKNIKKIDGIVSAIMALDASGRMAGPSHYEMHEVRSV